LTPEREAQLRGLEKVLGHRFRDLELLDRALTHTSRANEDLQNRTLHNEPLEFLGDSVLGFLVADMLHKADPDGQEGVKSKARAHLVSAASLAGRARALGLPELLLLGRGEEKTGGRGKGSLWADAYEAVVAALYLDGGFEAARTFAEREFRSELGAAPQPSGDPKSALQELLQGRGEAVPEYVLLASEGPSHRRHFRVGCRIAGRTVSEGEGFSKKEAQREAARKALVAVSPAEEEAEPSETAPRSTRLQGRSRPGRKPPPGRE
jgi:ribonuclease-3